MREYGQIQCAFGQSRTCKTISDSARVLATYLLSGPHSNGIGCYVLPDGYVMGDLRWPIEKVMESFGELSRNGFAYRSDEVVFIPDFIRWNAFRNGNVAIARMEEFRVLPRGESKARVAADILRHGEHLTAAHISALKGFSEPVPNGSEIIKPMSLNQNPTQTLPIPDPTHTRPNGVKANDISQLVPHGTLADDFSQFIAETYPETGHPSDHNTALHYAQALVGLGHATEADLRRRLTGFRAFANTGGYSDFGKIPTSQAWFKHDHPRKYWDHEWKAAPTKAEQQQDANIDAATKFLNRERA